MSLTATLTLWLPLLRTAVSAGCSGVGVVMSSVLQAPEGRGSGAGLGRWLEWSQPLGCGRPRPSTSECLHAQIRLACPLVRRLAARVGPRLEPSRRFVGAWALDAGTNRQRTILITQDGDALRARFGSAEPEPRLGPAEANLAADGTLSIKSAAGTFVILTVADDNTLTGRFVPSTGRETAARATRMPAEVAAALAAARPAARTVASAQAPADAPAYLAKAEVEAIATGKKWKLHRLSDGQDITWDMREGGRLFGRNLTQNTGDNATWSVNDKGELCVKWRGNSNDGCLAVARDGDAYKTYNPAQPAKPFHTLAVE